ncbi:MAG: rRNA maturation RNase YbeY [Bacilli bacterium]|nr:rRNA maturation RNase YbeY [Bacilli bacterium]
MELSFDNAFSPDYDEFEGEFSSLLEVAFSMLEVKIPYEVDVSLVDDKTIQEINRDYRNIDRVTDVISFAFNDDKSDLGKISGDCPRLLGEIFIDIPQALRQAKEIGNSSAREISFLFVHGLLHLLGYDHMKKEDEEIMFPLQERILSAYLEKKKA